MKHLLEGNISVKAAILAQRRKVERILVDEKKHDRDTRFILAQAVKQNIPIIKAKREDIDQLACGKTHGGLVAECDQRSFQSIEDYRERSQLFLALVEGIEDPFHFGDMLRSFYAAGCDGVIIPPRNWTSAAGIIAKASAGASEYIDMIVADDMEFILNECKSQQLQIVCALRNEAAVNVYDYQFPAKTVLAIGGAMRGLSKAVSTACDQAVYIPYANDFRNAMSASGSAAILAFEFLRQRQTKAINSANKTRSNSKRQR